MKQTARNILAACMLHEEANDGAECNRQTGRVRLQAIRCSAGSIEDLSMSGMKVRSRKRLKPSDKPVRFRIKLEDSTLELTGLVRWASKDKRGRLIGVEFVDPTDEQKANLRMLARTAASNTRMMTSIHGRVA